MVGARPFPRKINVELTNHCNQRCPLCPRQGFTRPLGFMDPALFERIARECAGRDTKLWLHFLGEPLLHRETPRLIALAKAAGVREVGLSTNAVSLHGPLAEAILASGLDRLECSMDALDRDGYVAMRGRNHFARVGRNLRAFLQRKREIGLDRLVTSIQFMRTAAIDASLREIVEAWRPFLGPRDFVMTIRPASFGGAVDTGTDPPAEDGATRPPCPWLFDSLMILQDGTVTMCGADWDASAPLGNVAHSSIEEVWKGREAERRRAAHLAGRFAEVGPCGGCEDWRLADGGGYANALREIDQRAAPRREPGAIPAALEPHRS